jgi:hypothetical protein
MLLTDREGWGYEEASLASPMEWLELVDSGKYDESWEETAGFFRRAVLKTTWRENMHAFRKPLGETLSRDVQSNTYRTSLPGAPDGEYVVIQFKTTFENKKSAIETVTPMLDDHGTWRVSGYYIK